MMEAWVVESKTGHLGLLRGRELSNYKFHEKLQLIFMELFLCVIPVRETLYTFSHWIHTIIQWIRRHYILILQMKILRKIWI